MGGADTYLSPLEAESVDHALVTFTTGSTGLPKLLLRKHEFLLNQSKALNIAKLQINEAWKLEDVIAFTNLATFLLDSLKVRYNDCRHTHIAQLARLGCLCAVFVYRCNVFVWHTPTTQESGSVVSTHTNSSIAPHYCILHGVTPYMHGATPYMHGVTPYMHGVTPHMHGATPYMHGATPYMHGVTPHMHGVTPYMHGVTPHMHGVTPHMHGVTPHMHGVTPHMHGVTPHMHGVTPHMHGVTPHMHGVTPHMHGVTPHMHGVTPYMHGVTPYMLGVIPDYAGWIDRIVTAEYPLLECS